MIARLLAHDTVRRAVRTFAQAFVASLLVLLPSDVIRDAAVLLELALAAGWSAAVALLTFVHGELEDAGRVPDTRHPKGSR